MSNDVIPYTHWAYFTTEGQAKKCAEVLGDYVTQIDPPLGEAASDAWLLRAGRDVEIGNLLQRHAEVEAIVVEHGGAYDGGEAAFLDTGDGLQPVVDPDLGRAEDPREAG